MSHAAYPATRLRRTRASGWSRALHRETVLTPGDLIWPLFVTGGEGVEEPIASLPGVSRWSVDRIAERAKEAVALGIPCVALFPNTPAEQRSDDGAEALNPDNLMCRAIKAVRDACGNDHRHPHRCRARSLYQPRAGRAARCDGLCDERRHRRDAGRPGDQPGRRRAPTSSRRPT